MIDGQRVEGNTERYNATESLDGEFVYPKYLGYSDYSNSSFVEVANVRAWQEAFADSEDVEWWTVTGGYGTVQIMVRRDADERVPAMGEFVDGLENDPSADDDLLSEVEMNAQAAAWENYGRNDFKRWLNKKFPAHEDVFDALSDEGFDWWWYELARNGNGEEVVMEYPSPYFNFDRLKLPSEFLVFLDDSIERGPELAMARMKSLR